MGSGYPPHPCSPTRSTKRTSPSTSGSSTRPSASRRTRMSCCLPARAEGPDQAAAGRELREQRLRDLRAAGGHHDRVVGGVGEPAARAVAEVHDDVRDAEPVERAARPARERRHAFDRDHARREPRRARPPGRPSRCRSRARSRCPGARARCSSPPRCRAPRWSGPRRSAAAPRRRRDGRALRARAYDAGCCASASSTRASRMPSRARRSNMRRRETCQRSPAARSARSILTPRIARSYSQRARARDQRPRRRGRMAAVACSRRPPGSCARSRSPQVDASERRGASRPSGRVHDRAGAPLVGAQVTVQSGEPAHRISVWSDADGRFATPELPSRGPWTVRARRIGWRDAERTGVLAGSQLVLEARAARRCRARWRRSSPRITGGASWSSASKRRASASG